MNFHSRCLPRTRNRRCTILAATYVFLDLTDSSNWIHTQRRTTRGSTKDKVSKKLLGVSSEKKSPAFISSFIFIAESTKRGTSLIMVIRGHLWSFTSNVTRSLPVIWSIYDQGDQSASRLSWKQIRNVAICSVCYELFVLPVRSGLMPFSESNL